MTLIGTILLSDTVDKLNELLVENKDLFVSKENPKLGLTKLVEQQIHLKHDKVSKHQRPYTFGIAYRKSCVLEFRYRKSTQNLYNDKLSSFEPVFSPEFGRFLFETKTMGLDMGICSFSFTIPIWKSIICYPPNSHN
jgi:hypothetical protein